MHLQRGASWVLLKRFWKLTPQGSYPPLSPSLTGSCALYVLPPAPRAAVCPIPALDCVPVRNQLLEGLLALQDDGELLLGETGPE